MADSGECLEMNLKRSQSPGSDLCSEMSLKKSHVVDNLLRKQSREKGREAPAPCPPRPMFGDEPEEKPRSGVKRYVDDQVEKPASSSGKQCGDEESSEDEKPELPSLSLSFGAMQLFERSKFLSAGAEASKPPTKKRAYDNSKREANAAPKKEDHSYRTMALKPNRLIDLMNKPNCQCAYGFTWLKDCHV